MKPIKLLAHVLVCLFAVSLAFATRTEKSKDAVIHNWVDKNNVLILIGTVAEAEANCPGDDFFCLRASDDPTLVVYMAR
jgi:hypothetical protein